MPIYAIPSGFNIILLYFQIGHEFLHQKYNYLSFPVGIARHRDGMGGATLLRTKTIPYLTSNSPQTHLLSRPLFEKS